MAGTNAIGPRVNTTITATQNPDSATSQTQTLKTAANVYLQKTGLNPKAWKEVIDRFDFDKERNQSRAESRFKELLNQIYEKLPSSLKADFLNAIKNDYGINFGIKALAKLYTNPSVPSPSGTDQPAPVATNESAIAPTIDGQQTVSQQSKVATGLAALQSDADCTTFIEKLKTLNDVNINAYIEDLKAKGMSSTDIVKNLKEVVAGMTNPNAVGMDILTKIGSVFDAKDNAEPVNPAT